MSKEIGAIYINGLKIESFNFPGGECHVKVLPSDITENYTYILAYLESSDSIMQLLMTVDAVRQVYPNTRIILTIPYFPYARQDRVCNEGEAFSVKVMANLINNMKCQSVTIYDPHSQVTVDLLNNCHVIPLSSLLVKSFLADIIMEKDMTIVSPDKGAKEKVSSVARMLGQRLVVGSKVRDPKTGHISGTAVEGDVSGQDCIILDDICDGGRTFIELSKVLKNKGAAKIYLCVTHGIYSKGLDVLREHFNHLYCYNSLISSDQMDPDFLTILGRI